MYDGGQVVQPKAKIREVQAVVAALHDLPVEAMWSKSRQHYLAHPRQEAMALARELTGRSYPEIGLMFGGKDHTTILYAHRKVTALAQTDAALAERLATARARIAALVAERVASQPQPVATSTSWQPPAPLRPAKPVRISVRLDLDAWQRLGGEMVA
jgi:hypothetical protein